jgi:hypothetical protein
MKAPIERIRGTQIGLRYGWLSARNCVEEFNDCSCVVYLTASRMGWLHNVQSFVLDQ